MKHRSFHWIIIAIALLPLVYLAIIWSSIPQTVPVHFNIKMEPDRMANKSELGVTALILSGVSILVYLLFINIQKIDPKRYKAGSSKVFNKIAAAIAIFVTLLNFVIINMSAGKMKVSGNLIFCLVGLLFAVMGNYMSNLKPNYFAGFRLPWTLSDDENWRKTHHLASKLWFAGGVLLAIISLVLSGQALIFTFFGITLIIVVIPIVYSYKVFKSKVSI